MEDCQHPQRRRLLPPLHQLEVLAGKAVTVQLVACSLAVVKDRLTLVRYRLRKPGLCLLKGCSRLLIPRIMNSIPLSLDQSRLSAITCNLEQSFNLDCTSTVNSLQADQST